MAGYSFRSRNDKDFTKRYPGVVAALDAAGKPVFSLLQDRFELLEWTADGHLRHSCVVVLLGSLRSVALAFWLVPCAHRKDCGILLADGLLACRY
jgi:hypothetical protein